MRRTATLLLLLLATPLFAVEEGRWQTSVLGVLHGGTVTVAYAPHPSWGVEAAVSAQGYERVVTNFFVGALPVTTFQHYTLNPVDIFVTRHFATGSRITPYVHAGARYIEVPDRPETDVSRDGGLPSTRFTFGSRTSAEAGGGVRLRLTRRTAVRVEATRLLRSNASRFDPLTRAAAGLSWHF
jgi:hypothetical protein